MHTIRLTLTQASHEFGASKDTIAKRLRDIGIATGRSATYSIRDIHRALAGDWRVEKTKEVRARTCLLELDRKQREGDLLASADVQEQIDKCFGNVRQAVLQALAEIPARANPQDHAMARRAVQSWVDRFFPFVREAQASDKAIPFPPPPKASPAE